MYKRLLLVTFMFIVWYVCAFSNVYTHTSNKPSQLPEIKAIFWNNSNNKGLVRINDLLYYVSDKMHVDKEWKVEEIRREKILFFRNSTKTYVEIPVYSIDGGGRKFHRDYSFFGKPISLWEALVLICNSFNYNVSMHYLAGGTVVPNHHGLKIDQFIRKIMPSNHRFFFNNNTLFVLPVKCYTESWSEVRSRVQQFNPISLEKRFIGLKKFGTLISFGDDIQFVLRKISLGGCTPIQFPKDLHFPVYAYFKNVSYSFILSFIVQLNQCIIIERENAIEIRPFIENVYYNNSKTIIKAEPYEPQQGFGPSPPFPIMPPNVKFTGVNLK